MSALWITGCTTCHVKRSCFCRAGQPCAAHLTMYLSSVNVGLFLQRAASLALSAARDHSWLWPLCCCAMPTLLKSTKTVFLTRQVFQQAGSVLLVSSWWATSRASAQQNWEEFYGKSQGEVDNAKVLHYVGAGIAFPTSMLFVCLQSALTYRLAKTQGEYNVAHLRLCMTLLAFVALVLSGVFFCQESFVLQHASAIFEWVFCVIIMLFYGTFAFEFAGMSGDTMAVLARGGALGPGGREHKVDALGGPGPHSHSHPHQPESMSIL
ncbi:transmembrane protein 150A isoform X2 [Acanthopagrus latus]|uniref:transmembrane protein 150A isoform X2 n=1 Tax=Acanthopagrus latus TaxID=8177 RepID=UPI00187CF237|nr:transmembrane protein 150A isoform X2 [Acanthopagrus latus]